jgi:hypothetical protein
MANIGNQSIGNLNLFVKQGNTQTFRLAFNNVLPNGTKEPIDLDQYTEIKMDVKPKSMLMRFLLSVGRLVMG